ncbi:hypothetical protein MBLNU459_g0138t1 [Dothideomycetes sp. NU459]
MFTEAGLLSSVVAWGLFLSAPVVNAAATIDMSAIGASTSLSAKSTVCNVLDYGGVADDSTDIGPAISKAFTSCVKGNAATLYIPEGSYSMATGVVLSGASGWAFQLDGLITLTSDGDFNGNAIVIESGSDIEFFSSNNLGAINGQGYIMRKDDTSQNARLVRFMSVSNLAIHNIILIDSPYFHLVLNDVSNLDLYYITIRGADIGATDGIDLECTDNCYLHEFEVTNRDECVSVKSPSNNVLIEEAYCNHSGGMSIGSLTADITDSSDASAVSNITMRNIYAYECTNMLMIKTYPGGNDAEGYVKDSLFENFIGWSTTYALDIDQYWQSKTTPNTGAVALSGLTFSNWTGSLANGIQRGAVVIRGSDIVPLQDITLEDFDMWSLYSDKVVNQCKNVYGTGMCIQAASGTAAYTTSVTSTVSPTGWTSPAAPTWAVTGYGTTIPIPIYTPAVFWPTASSGAEAAAVVATTTAKPSATSSSVTVAAVAVTSSAEAAYTSSKASVTSLATSAPISIAKASSSSVAQVSSTSSVAKIVSTASAAQTSSSSATTDKVSFATSAISTPSVSAYSNTLTSAAPSPLSSSVASSALSSIATPSTAPEKTSVAAIATTSAPTSSEVLACPSPVMVTVYV